MKKIYSKPKVQLLNMSTEDNLLLIFSDYFAGEGFAKHTGSSNNYYRASDSWIEEEEEDFVWGDLWHNKKNSLN